MASPTWYLGPPEDLRALECAEVNIDMPVERYGGVFQALSGSRTVDVTGFRQRFGFEFNYLDIDQYKWLEALFLRVIPGPLRLLNPMKKNRVTPESSAARWGGGTAQGLYLTSGGQSLEWDWPSGVGGIAAVTTKWFGRNANAVFRTDQIKRITVLPSETITGSIYMKASAPVSYNLLFDWHSRTGSLGSSAVTVASVTTSWQRFTVTATAPVGAISATFAGYSANTTADVFLGPIQVEAGNVATGWEIGGGAPMVSIDQMPVLSPRYPLRNITMTVLEV
jgi:hypothetical protein